LEHERGEVLRRGLQEPVDLGQLRIATDNLQDGHDRTLPLGWSLLLESDAV